MHADESASQVIDVMFADLGDWRGEILSQVRALIRQAAPGVVEELKWKKPTRSSRTGRTA